MKGISILQKWSGVLLLVVLSFTLTACQEGDTGIVTGGEDIVVDPSGDSLLGDVSVPDVPTPDVPESDATPPDGEADGGGECAAPAPF